MSVEKKNIEIFSSTSARLFNIERFGRNRTSLKSNLIPSSIVGMEQVNIREILSSGTRFDFQDDNGKNVFTKQSIKQQQN
ncbi:hypothetical protein DERP_004513 [Dermatophagoides pteronyssinus]|uniref:Uncharacterized protein n=1 Tax=Dermatophagoides pteronyssinus TaxID=6956 RepID=A0ABQ8JPV6_DERPT|nr:hypothetical protein DERP_004513 [Dermatophagoides pteronyssinus]